MDDFGAQINFKQLLDRHHRIKVPLIQRDFAQGRDSEREVREEFLNSLHAALILPATDESLPLNLDFIYGSIEGENDKRFLPLDGQQRLTTLFLLHWYLSWQDGLGDKFKEFFCSNGESRFLYSVRPSSTEFFNELVGYQPENKENDTTRLSDLIKNQPWFYSHWRLDPTIQSCLAMLDSIHNKFLGTSGLYSRLIDESLPAITFQLLDLDNFGLSDDLYIKMNARGKPLTAFETFKARYEQELKNLFVNETRKIGEKDLSVADYFSISIDNRWSDFFWAHRDKETNLYDEAVMNLFRTVALLTRDLENDSFINSFNLLRNKINPPSYNLFHNENWLDRNFSELLFVLLEVWSKNPTDLSSRLPKSTYFDEAYFINTILTDPTSLDSTEIVQLFGYFIFIRENAAEIDSDAFQEWMRIVSNLSINTSYERPADIQRSLSGLLKISESSRKIIEYFANSEKPVTGFSMQQISEEKIKAELILAEPGWRKLIDQAELHGYFKGQIEFLLVFCGAIGLYETTEKNTLLSDDHLLLQNNFEKYLNYAETMFNNRGLVELEDYKWERALLSVGDYFIPSGSNFSFGVNSSTDQASWKRLLRGTGYLVPEARQVLKDFWDTLSGTSSIVNQLENLIGNATNIDLDPWRMAFIDTPEAFKYCDKNSVRFTENGDVFLLKKTQMNGAHAELFSYSLFNNIVKPLHDNRSLIPLNYVYYVPVVGTEEYPYIRLSGEFQESWLDFKIYSEEENHFEIYISQVLLLELSVLREKLENKLGFQKYESDFYLSFSRDDAEDTLLFLVQTLNESESHH